MTNLWFLYPNQIFKIHSTFFEKSLKKFEKKLKKVLKKSLKKSLENS